MTTNSWTIRVSGYLPIDDRMEDRIERLCAEIESLPASALQIDEEAGVLTIDYAQVRDHLQASRQTIHSVRVGDRMVVKPPWEDCRRSAEDLVLEIDPGAVFGSGLHESTRLCLLALETRLRRGCSVVDFGTGSGILAIAAAKLGAARVTAADADPDAIEVARANVRRNGVEQSVAVIETDSPLSIGLRADMVTANITAKTIMTLRDQLAYIVRDGGLLVASGMTHREDEGVSLSMGEVGFSVIDRLTEGQWVALVLVKSGNDQWAGSDFGDVLS
jgi:ribosomal protein L11 methyltransferase